MSVSLPALTTVMVLELNVSTLGVVTFADVELALMAMELTVMVRNFNHITFWVVKSYTSAFLILSKLSNTADFFSEVYLVWGRKLLI